MKKVHIRQCILGSLMKQQQECGYHCLKEENFTMYSDRKHMFWVYTAINYNSLHCIEYCMSTTKVSAQSTSGSSSLKALKSCVPMIQRIVGSMKN